MKIQNVNTDNQLYVGNLSKYVSDELLFNTFYKYGTIASVKVMKDALTKKSRGFGFVNFVNPMAAIRTQKAMDGKRLFGRNIIVCLQSKQRSLQKENNIIVYDLPPITEDELRKELAEYGGIFSIKISENKSQEDVVEHNKKL